MGTVRALVNAFATPVGLVQLVMYVLSNRIAQILETAPSRQDVPVTIPWTENVRLKIIHQS